MMNRAGFKLKLALPEEAAYAALLTDYIRRTQPESRDYCLVDVGHAGIRMFILRDDRFITRRTIDLGMLDLIRSISERQGVDEHIALTHMLSNYEGAMTDPASMDLYHRRRRSPRPSTSITTTTGSRRCAACTCAAAARRWATSATPSARWRIWRYCPQRT